MKKIILIFSILLFLNSCATKPKTKIESKDSEKLNIETIDLSNKGLKLKIGPTWYDNESKIYLVYGVPEENNNVNFITELHFNFGGNIDCENKSLLATFNFKNSPELILSDSINKLLPAAKNIIERNQENSSVKFDFKNLDPGILVFAIEKVNLKPNGKRNEVNLKIESQCLEYLNLPLILTKYNVSEINDLINKYIKNELNLLSENELKNLKVIFSFNKTYIINLFPYFLILNSHCRKTQRPLSLCNYHSHNERYYSSHLGH